VHRDFYISILDERGFGRAFARVNDNYTQ
jgi:hypothetical protein